MEALIKFLYKDEERIVDITTIDYWRQVFFAVAILASILGGLLLILLSPAIMAEKDWLTTTLFTALIYLVSVAICIHKRVAKYFRYIFLVSVLYGAGFFMLFVFYNLLLGDMLIILAFVIAAFVLSADDLKALIIVNIFVLIVMSILYKVKLLPYIPGFIEGFHWYYFILTMLVITLVIVLLISILLNGLESMIGELKVSEMRMKTIFNSMPSGLVMLDSRGIITDANTFIQQKVKVKKSQVVGRHIDEVVLQLTTHSKNPLDGFFDKLLQVEVNYEVYFEDDNGHLYLNCDMTRLAKNNSHNGEYVVIVHDVTEIRDAASNMVHSSKMEAIGTMAGGIAHDFNNMLGGILGYAQLNDQQIQQADSQDSGYNNKIIDAALKASSLTKQLLTYARKEEIVRQVVDINASLRNVVLLMDRTFEKRIRIKLDLTEEPALIHGDTGMLENALLNIGINAKDSMTLGQELLIKSERIYLDSNYCSNSDFELEAGHYIVVSFEDEGNGMGPDTVKRVFEPFFTTKEVGKGTGLGLSAAYGTVVAHRGEIKVQSQLFLGTQVEVVLPVLNDRVLEMESVVSYETLKSTVFDVGVNKPLVSKGKILIVDDEEVIRSMLVEMVKLLGYEVIVAEDGQAAIEIIELAPMSFDCVFLDMIMPNANGKDVLKAIRAVRENVPVAVISGYMRDEKLDGLYNEGADVILSKPFSLQQVTEVLNGWSKDS